MAAIMQTRHRRDGFSAPEIQDLLSWISPDSREDWVKVGAVIKHELGDGGWPVWDDWSQGSDRYRPKDAAAVWRSLKAHHRPVTGATLVHLARRGGWRPGAHTKPERPLPLPRLAPVETSSTENYAAKLWAAGDESDEAVMGHPYAVKKHLRSAGGARRAQASGSLIGRDADVLLVPCREFGTGLITGVQAIAADGAKQSFGKFSGGFLLLGNTLDKSRRWFVCEGWASAYAVAFHHGGHCCAVSFGKGRLEQVAQHIDAHYAPFSVAVIWEDDA